MANCCDVKLRTVGLGIAWLGMIASVLGVIVFAVSLVALDNLDDAITETSGTTKEDVRRLFPIFACVVIVLWVGGFVISLLLFLGIKKDRPGMILAWLIVSAICLVLAALSQLIKIVGGNHFRCNPWLTIVFQGFMWGIIFKLYKQIKQERGTSRDAYPHAPIPMDPK